MTKSNVNDIILYIDNQIKVLRYKADNADNYSYKMHLEFIINELCAVKQFIKESNVNW